MHFTKVHCTRKPLWAVVPQKLLVSTKRKATLTGTICFQAQRYNVYKTYKKQSVGAIFRLFVWFGLVWGLLWVLNDKSLVLFFFLLVIALIVRSRKTWSDRLMDILKKITTECDKAAANLMAWVQEVWLQWQPTAGAFLYNLQQWIQNRSLLLLDWWPPQSRSGKGQRQLQTHAASGVDSREFPIFSLGVASFQRSQTLKDKL